MAPGGKKYVGGRKRLLESLDMDPISGVDFKRGFPIQKLLNKFKNYLGFKV